MFASFKILQVRYLYYYFYSFCSSSLKEIKITSKETGKGSQAMYISTLIPLNQQQGCMVDTVPTVPHL